MMLVATTSYAYDVEIDGIYYNLISKAKTAEVTHGDSKYTGAVVIPPKITHEGIEYQITAIGNEAFRSCSSLTSISIPNTVVTLANYAFPSCTSLTSIDIPNSVKTIGASAFENCKSLTSVKIPNSVTTIGLRAFKNCSSLNLINIPNSVTDIDIIAFENCTSLSSINIPNSVTTIKGLTFGSCISLTSINIPASVKEIKDLAFAYCKNLESIYCPRETPPTTGTEAFKDSYIEYATLYVPEEAIAKYKTTIPWSTFGNILPLQCQAPEIQYADATLNITSATPGAKCYYSIECEDATETTEVRGPIELTKTYTITAYAEAEGFKTSEPTTLKLSASQLAEGDVDGNGKLSISDVTTLINNILKK